MRRKLIINMKNMLGNIRQGYVMKGKADGMQLSSTSSSEARIVQLRDEKGKGMDLLQYEEVIHPVYMDIPRKLKSVKEFKYAVDDVFLCSYPKSGTHWMSAMVYLLRHARSQEEIASCKIPLIPFIDLFSTTKLAAQPRPRLLASHLHYHRLPVEHAQNGAKIILMLRNPKDAAVSLFYHMKNQDEFKNQQSWDGYLKSFMKGEVLFGSIWNYVRSWQTVITEEQHTNLMVIYYEDVVQDCFKELKRVQEFLGLNRSDDTLRHIEQRCSYKSLQTAVETGQMPTVVRDEKGGSILLRRGQIGDWKTHFSQDQNEAFDEHCRKELGDSIFNFRYEDIPLRHKL